MHWIPAFVKFLLSLTPPKRPTTGQGDPNAVGAVYSEPNFGGVSRNILRWGCYNIDKKNTGFEVQSLHTRQLTMCVAYSEKNCKGKLTTYSRDLVDLRDNPVKSIFCYDGSPRKRRTKSYLSEVIEDSDP